MEKNKWKNQALLIGETVEKNREIIVEFFRDLLKIPSVTGDEKKVKEAFGRNRMLSGDSEEGNRKEHTIKLLKNLQS